MPQPFWHLRPSPDQGGRFPRPRTNVTHFIRGALPGVIVFPDGDDRERPSRRMCFHCNAYAEGNKRMSDSDLKDSWLGDSSEPVGALRNSEGCPPWGQSVLAVAQEKRGHGNRQALLAQPCRVLLAVSIWDRQRQSYGVARAPQQDQAPCPVDCGCCLL